MFKINLKAVSFLIIFFAGSVALAQTPKYPAILQVEGSAWNVIKEKERIPLKKSDVLREKAQLVTGPDSEVKIQLDANRVFSLLPDSELSLPAISWESGEVPVLNLRRGGVHWDQDLSRKASYNTAISSPLFQFLSTPGNYAVGLNPAKATAYLKVYKGELNFAALNAEDSVQVKAGQQVEFKGVLEDGEIAYDLLLQGKRIPKGTLQKVQALDLSALKAQEKLEAAKKARLKDLQAKKELKAKEMVRQGYICKNPLGRLNQCSWTCRSFGPKGTCKTSTADSEACVRRRCNANGQWAEATSLDSQQASLKCKASVVVDMCDY